MLVTKRSALIFHAIFHSQSSRITRKNSSTDFKNSMQLSLLRGPTIQLKMEMLSQQDLLPTYTSFIMKTIAIPRSPGRPLGLSCR